MSVPRQFARRNLRGQLEEIQQKLNAIRREIDGYILGLEHEDLSEGRFVEQEACDEAASEVDALSSNVTGCEQAVEQLYHLVWTEF